MKKYLAIAILTSTLALFMTVAFASDAAPSDDAGAVSSPTTDPVPSEPLGLIEIGYEAVTEGNWSHGAAVAVLLIVLGLRASDSVRAWVRKWIGFGSDDRGGVILALLLATLGGVTHAILADGVGWLDLEPWRTGFVIGIEAIGGFVAIKKIFRPKD